MTRTTFQSLHRTARLGNLGSLCFAAGSLYDWFLSEVYDIRFPHVGGVRHEPPHTFDSLRISTAKRLAWKRQSAYVAQIAFCSRCKSHHHRLQECQRRDSSGLPY